MSRITVGPPSGDDEVRALSEVLNRTYLRTAEEGREWLKRVSLDEIRVVRSGAEIAGVARLMPFAQWFGGRPVPMTGVASVAVDPEHRASGMASTLMRSLLEEMHTDGVALSALYPATQPVYRLAGWELAGDWVRYRLPTDKIDMRDRSLDVSRLENPTPDDLRPLYTKRARTTAGNLDRDEGTWRRIIDGRPDEDVHVYRFSDEGYVSFVQKRESGWQYDLRCLDLVALTPAAARRILTFFADHRSFANDLEWTSGPADPFLFHLREQAWKAHRRWTWMQRVVDVRGALAGRGYPSAVDAELHLEVRDDVLEWNEGRFVLSVSDGEGEVRKGGRGKLKIDVRGLASLYTGYLSARELATTGYIEGAERDLDRATAIFAGPAPWSADFF